MYEDLCLGHFRLGQIMAGHKTIKNKKTTHKENHVTHIS